MAAPSRARRAFAHRVHHCQPGQPGDLPDPADCAAAGFDAIVGERERGSLDLLLSLPITRLELLLAKYLGLAAALTLSTLVGFGLVAVLLYQHVSWSGLYHYIGSSMISSVLLGLAF